MNISIFHMRRKIVYQATGASLRHHFRLIKAVSLYPSAGKLRLMLFDNFIPPYQNILIPVSQTL